jgi:hypothetical protein
MDVQRKLEILADANLARGIPQKALSFIVLGDHRRISSMARGLKERFKPKAAQLRFWF